MISENNKGWKVRTQYKLWKPLIIDTPRSLCFSSLSHLVGKEKKTTQLNMAIGDVGSPNQQTPSHRRLPSLQCALVRQQLSKCVLAIGKRDTSSLEFEAITLLLAHIKLLLHHRVIVCPGHQSPLLSHLSLLQNPRGPLWCPSRLPHGVLHAQSLRSPLRQPNRRLQWGFLPSSKTMTQLRRGIRVRYRDSREKQKEGLTVFLPSQIVRELRVETLVM